MYWKVITKWKVVQGLGVCLSWTSLVQIKFLFNNYFILAFHKQKQNERNKTFRLVRRGRHESHLIAKRFKITVSLCGDHESLNECQYVYMSVDARRSDNMIIKLVTVVCVMDNRWLAEKSNNRRLFRFRSGRLLKFPSSLMESPKSLLQLPVQSSCLLFSSP